jgi:hypothetical protein
MSAQGNYPVEEEEADLFGDLKIDYDLLKHLPAYQRILYGKVYGKV